MLRTNFAAFLVLFVLPSHLRAGPENCDSDGGPTVCVRFDNLAGTPILGTDVTFDFSSPQAPNIILERGGDGSSLFLWRVWSKDAQNVAAAIGDITTPGDYNYFVKVRDPSDGAGASSANSMILSPAGDHWSIIADGHIDGNVTNNIALQSNSGGVGGTLDLVVGEFSGNLNVPTIDSLVVDGPMSGTISSARLMNWLSLV